ncbi:uncharacterized protein LOC144348661, partial [Saccoglossus kowalevskii]
FRLISIPISSSPSQSLFGSFDRSRPQCSSISDHQHYAIFSYNSKSFAQGSHGYIKTDRRKRAILKTETKSPQENNINPFRSSENQRVRIDPAVFVYCYQKMTEKDESVFIQLGKNK